LVCSHRKNRHRASPIECYGTSRPTDKVCGESLSAMNSRYLGATLLGNSKEVRPLIRDNVPQLDGAGEEPKQTTRSAMVAQRT
jgi:hypothetical protein